MTKQKNCVEEPEKRPAPVKKVSKSVAKLRFKSNLINAMSKVK